ncbi:MAG TPA: DUF4351 domain-containing protein [Bryobacteraceae bacterium]|nr:DUF4351 domain-containing protein [Bryobacteraceae bacterium]
MYNYDAALKLILTESAAVTIRTVSGLTVKRWHNVELTRVKRYHVDLLGETRSGRSLHIELQSRNDRSMPRRMLQYGTAVLEKYGRYPKQVLLYFGTAPMRMKSEYQANEDFRFRYTAVDIRSLDGKKLPASDGIGDNVLAILARQQNERKAVREIVGRIAGLDESGRQSRLEQLMILAGLRHLGPLVQQEASRMPITENILDHEVIGPVYKRGLREGRKEGRKVGRQEGELAIVRRLVTKRFGAVPDWLDARLERCSPEELGEIGIRVLDAKTPEDLIK